MRVGVPDRATVSRRAALSVFAGGALTAGGATPASLPLSAAPDPVVLPYGADPSQFGELTIPFQPSTSLVVLIHGGFCFDVYDLELGRPLAADLVGRGYPVWNLEYRRSGNGGGCGAR